MPDPKKDGVPVELQIGANKVKIGDWVCDCATGVNELFLTIDNFSLSGGIDFSALVSHFAWLTDWLNGKKADLNQKISKKKPGGGTGADADFSFNGRVTFTSRMVNRPCPDAPSHFRLLGYRLVLNFAFDIGAGAQVTTPAGGAAAGGELAGSFDYLVAYDFSLCECPAPKTAALLRTSDETSLADLELPASGSGEESASPELAVSLPAELRLPVDAELRSLAGWTELRVPEADLAAARLKLVEGRAAIILPLKGSEAISRPILA